MTRERTRDRAIGRWPSILQSLGIPAESLRNRHGPCPVCDGKKSFRFDNKEGTGTWICTHCGAGDGIGLAAAFLGVGLGEAMKRIDAVLPQAIESAAPKQKDNSAVKARMQRLWREATSIEGTLAQAYLYERTGRWIRAEEVPDLRFHTGVQYWDVEDNKAVMLGTFPCMLALVRDASGHVVGVHRTYLQEGARKANVPAAKKLATWAPIAGGAIRMGLGSQSDTLGVAEGIETALASSLRFGTTVWATISTSGMMAFEPPAGTSTVVVYADNDSNYAGHAAAYALAHRLKTRRQIEVLVLVPPDRDSDWADYKGEA